MARIPGVQDGIMRCVECNGAMVKVGNAYRCMDKVPPEELLAVGFIPSKDSSGKLKFESTTIDQQKIQAAQAYSKGVEIDDAYLKSLGLDLEKIRHYQLQHQLVP